MNSNFRLLHGSYYCGSYVEENGTSAGSYEKTGFDALLVVSR